MSPSPMATITSSLFGVNFPTTGAAKPDQRFIDVARELMVGLGYQETLNTTLTNPENLFRKMNAEPNKNH